jgi:hypothetical protein
LSTGARAALSNVRTALTGSTAGRTFLLIAAAAGGLAIVTAVPIVPTTLGGDGIRLVPLDTWLGGHFPGLRDFYRARLAVAASPSHLTLVLLSIALVAAAALSFPRPLGEWLAQRVPPLSAEALGAYRAVLGLAMFAAWRTIAPPDAIPWDLHRSSEWLARLPIVRMLAASPDGAWWLWQSASIALLSFAAGLQSRLSLGVAAASMTLLVGVLLTTKAMHDWGVPLVTLWALMLVPWRDAAGVETAVMHRRKRAVRPVAPEQRGLAIWLPGLTIGTAFAAAAFAKLDTSGLEWVTGGAVRFHFIEDARQAPVPWGMSVAGSDAAAVALSLGAIVVEGCFWLVLWVRSLVARALFGLAGLAMLGGFYLFQGVFWPGWWALFLAFAPWPLLGRSSEAVGVRGRAGLPALQAAAVVLLAAQQPVVSAIRLESEPFLSDFSMYAYTWPSKEAFDRHLRTKTAQIEITASDLDPAEFSARLRRIPRAHDTVVEAIETAAAGAPWDAATQAAVKAARRSYEQNYRQQLSRVQVTIVERGFDWDRGAFSPPRIAATGIVDLDSGRFQPLELTSRTSNP